MAATVHGRTSVPPVLDERYELGPLLGRGGMSDVYRAHDRFTGCDVAVKIFRAGVDLLDADHRRRREVQLALSLDHPGLVRMLDTEHGVSDSDDDPAYLVVELVEGETLGRLLRRGPLAEPEVVQLGAALCAALAYIHERGIVHRDVKPANVLIEPDGCGGRRPKLTDFGIARVVDSTRMTVEGFTVGTPNYLSPEQVTGRGVGVPSDVYSLGLVLVEALTGELVYPGYGVEAAVARLHRDPRVPASTSPQLAALLSAMTAREPRRRPTAAQAQSRFQQLRSSSGTRRPLGVVAAMNRNPRRRAAAGLGLVGSLAAATVATVLMLSPDAAPGGPQPRPGGRPTANPAAPAPAAPAPTGRAGAPRTTGPVSAGSHPVRPVAARPTMSPAARADVAVLRAAIPVRHRDAHPKDPSKGHGHGKHGGDGGDGGD